MCDYKKGSRIKTGVFFCDRVLVFASHIRYNDRKLFQRERRKTVMKKIVFATGNAGKMKEIREILADLPVEIYSMKEAGISVEIDENGKTFEENAKIKAQTVAGCTDGDTIVLADDSGLEVDALNGELVSIRQDIWERIRPTASKIRASLTAWRACRWKKERHDSSV